MKIYTIPYFNNYYLSKDCKVYKKCEDIENGVIRVYETASGLYTIETNNEFIQMTIGEIIALVRLGYCNPENFKVTYNSSDMFESVEYIIDTIILENNKAYINGTLFMQSPRWPHLYSNKYGAIFDINKKRFRKQKQDRDGYCRFSPVQDATNFAVHRFVYECWTQQILSSDIVIHHKNSDKTYNYFDNLELTTPAQNTRYSIINNERNLIHSFNVEDIHKMCKMMQEGKTYREIASEFSIDPNDERQYKTFRNRLNLLLQKKISWIDISSQYDFTEYVGNLDPNIKFSQNDILLMHQMHANGISPKIIAENFGTTRHYVYDVLCGKKRHIEYELFMEGSTTIESVA